MRNRYLIYLRESNMPGADNDLEAHLARMLVLGSTLGGVFNPETDIYREPKGRRSAQSDKSRPEYRKIMLRVDDDGSDVRWILGNDRARMWREPSEYGSWLKHIKKIGVEFIPATEVPIQDIDTAIGMASEYMIGIMNAFYAKYVGEKRKAQFDSLREKTWYVSTNPPQGLRSQGRGLERRMVVSEETYQANGITRGVIDVAIEARRLFIAHDVGFRTLAKKLNEAGYMWKHGKRFGIVRPLTLCRNFELHRLYYEVGAIDETMYLQLLRKTKQRSVPSMSRRPSQNPLMLQKILYCAECGYMLTGQYHPLYYNSLYRHQLNECQWGRAIAARKIDNLFLEKIREFEDYSDDEVREMFNELQARRTSKIDLQAKRDRLTVMLKNLEDAYLAGDLGELAIARPRYLRRRGELQEELSEIPEIEQDDIDTEHVLASMSEFFDLLERLQESLPTALNRIVREFTDRVEYNFETGEMKVFLIGESMS